MIAMLKALVLASAAITLASAAPVPPAPVCAPVPPPPVGPKVAANSTYASSDAPPARFQADIRAEVTFVNRGDLQRICGRGAPPPCGKIFLGCNQGGKLVIPNPCPDAERDPYAKLLCHELAHSNGWPVSHGD